MVYELILVAIGVMVGLPLALFGVMRIDEERGRLGTAALVIGLLITFGPMVAASITHYRTTGGGERYGSQ